MAWWILACAYIDAELALARQELPEGGAPSDESPPIDTASPGGGSSGPPYDHSPWPQRPDTAHDTGARNDTGGILGNRLDAAWRPFADDAPWNAPIAADAPTHGDSEAILSTVGAAATRLRFTNSYLLPLWNVRSAGMELLAVRSDDIYDTWDEDQDGWSDVGVPLTVDMWIEPTENGHVSILDLELGIAWEMSGFQWASDGTPTATTFNLWELDGAGYDVPPAGTDFHVRGGRGAGFPTLAGLLRPEEVLSGEIRHALVFSFGQVRRSSDGSDLFVSPPACRSDGDAIGTGYPVAGMLFQLDPTLGEADFDAWGLTDEAKVVARALQAYGMYLGDQGGDMALQVQLLGPTSEASREAWDNEVPGLYDSIEAIPTGAFRVIDVGTLTAR